MVSVANRVFSFNLKSRYCVDIFFIMLQSIWEYSQHFGFSTIYYHWNNLCRQIRICSVSKLKSISLIPFGILLILWCHVNITEMANINLWYFGCFCGPVKACKHNWYDWHTLNNFSVAFVDKWRLVKEKSIREKILACKNRCEL